jgi:hypothetical protein
MGLATWAREKYDWMIREKKNTVWVRPDDGVQARKKSQNIAQRKDRIA